MFSFRCFTLIVGTLVVTLGLIAGCPPPTGPCLFVSCDDGDACTTDSCDDSSGSVVCSHVAVDCAGRVCNPVNGACEDCVTDADCDDGFFCNGAEICSNGNNCVSPGNPCAPGEACDDFADVCFGPAGIRCTSDADCPDDGLFCNGVGTCDLTDPANGVCVSSGNPCADDGLFCTGTESCDEATAACVANGDPCATGETCNETTDTCDTSVACTTDADCPDDGLFCNGVGTCDLADPANGFCVTGAAPCAFGQTCTEGATAAICGGGGTQCTGDGACSALPACYSPGVSLSVSVTISAPSSAIVAALEDSPPSGWVVNAATISDSGAWDSNNLKVKWAFIENPSRTVTYDVTPTSSASGTACFSGSVFFDSSGNGVSVAGDRCINPCGGG